MSDETQPWPDGMDAAERVRHVALTRTTPRNAGWIATEATVSRDTAVKYLSRLVEQGELTTVETASGTCYRPDDVTQFLREVREFAENHSQTELTDELQAIGAEIDNWKTRYGVDSLPELRQSLGREDLTNEERRARREVVDEWAYDTEVREALQLAISLKQSLTALDRDSFTDTPAGAPQEG